MNDIDEDDCTATEKLWVSYEAYHNRESEKSNTFVIIIAVLYHYCSNSYIVFKTISFLFMNTFPT